MTEDVQGRRFVQSPSRGLDIRVKDGGYLPKSGLFLVDAMLKLSLTGLRALDLGTGETGIIANCLKAQGAARITACDIDGEVIAHASSASRLSAGIDWVKSDLFSDLPDCCYDFIVSNPPQMPMPQAGRAHDYGGSDGREIILQIMRGSALRLNPGGQLVMLCFDFLGTDRRTNDRHSLIEFGRGLGLIGRILASKDQSIRRGGETEKNIRWIRSIYPLYDFATDCCGEKQYQLHALHFQKE